MSASDDKTLPSAEGPAPGLALPPSSEHAIDGLNHSLWPAPANSKFAPSSIGQELPASQPNQQADRPRQAGFADDGTALRGGEEKLQSLTAATERRQSEAAGPTTEEINERLDKLWSPSLVDVLYDLGKNQVLAEERRLTLLMTKANSLLGVTGFSLTVAFTFGGMLLQRSMSEWARWLYLLGLATGLGAAICAIAAMFIRQSRGVSAKDVFDPTALASADAADVTKFPVAPGESVVSSQVGSTAYKRNLVSHLWQIYQFNSSQHDMTAGLIRKGQILYSAFLVSILVNGGLLAAEFNGRRSSNDASQIIASAGAGFIPAPGITSPANGTDASLATAFPATTFAFDGGLEIQPALNQDAGPHIAPTPGNGSHDAPLHANVPTRR